VGDREVNGILITPTHPQLFDFYKPKQIICMEIYIVCLSHQTTTNRQNLSLLLLNFLDFKITKRLQFQHDQYNTIPSGYGSMKWSEWFYSVPLSIAQSWDQEGRPVSLSHNTAGKLFGLESFEAASAQVDQAFVLLRGLRNGVLYYSEILKLTRERQTIRFYWTRIDTLEFVPQEEGEAKWFILTEMTVAV
jgi:hypothetical protein